MTVMASHSSSGFATTSASASADTVSSTSGNGNGNPGMQGLSSSSSLPFSFLVTFVAIFLFFLGCGLGSRRVTRTLRRNLGLEVTNLGGDRRVARPPRKRPLLWDAFPHEAPSPTLRCTRLDDRVFSHPWDVLAPVSATYVRTSTPRPAMSAAAPTPAPGPQTAPSPRWPLGGTGFAASRGLMRAIPRLPPPPTPRAVPPAPALTASRSATAAPRRAAPEMRWRGRRVPDWIARLLMPDPLDGPLAGTGFDPDARSECPVLDATSEGDNTEVQALQVVVLVSMPSPERARRSRLRAKALEAERRNGTRDSGKFFRPEVEVSARETIGEYVLGSARVPWKEGEIGAFR